MWKHKKFGQYYWRHEAGLGNKMIDKTYIGNDDSLWIFLFKATSTSRLVSLPVCMRVGGHGLCYSHLTYRQWSSLCRQSNRFFYVKRHLTLVSSGFGHFKRLFKLAALTNYISWKKNIDQHDKKYYYIFLPYRPALTQNFLINYSEQQKVFTMKYNKNRGFSKN